MTANSIANIFSEPSMLTNILEKAKRLRQLNTLFLSFIDVRYRENCCVANFRDGQLIIQAENAAIATQLKYQTQELLTQFRANGLPNLIAIKIIVRPAEVL